MNAPRHRRPYLWIASHERVDLVGRQLVTLIPQLRERFVRPLNELAAQVVVCEQAADDQLNRFLRHTSADRNLRTACRPTQIRRKRARA
jgi:hypothetical protein